MDGITLDPEVHSGALDCVGSGETGLVWDGIEKRWLIENSMYPPVIQGIHQ